MRAAVGKVPQAPDDTRMHCMATGLIARYCSTTEAVLAGTGKELRDLFGRGDASLSDIRADRRGLACARRAEDDAALVRCCDGS